jgi:hypothetical protein
MCSQSTENKRPRMNLSLGTKKELSGLSGGMAIFRGSLFFFLSR